MARKLILSVDDDITRIIERAMDEITRVKGFYVRGALLNKNSTATEREGARLNIDRCEKVKNDLAVIIRTHIPRK